MYLSIFYTEADIARECGAHEVYKGKNYLNKVSHLQIVADRIIAQVQGTSRRLYQVNIQLELESGRNELTIDGECSCPVSYNCKHVAATLLKALQDHEKISPHHFNPQVLQWMEELTPITSATTDPDKTTRNTPKKNEHLFYFLNDKDAQEIFFCKGRFKSNGRPEENVKDWHNVERALLNPPQFMTQDDYEIVRMLWQQRDKSRSYFYSFPLVGSYCDELLKRLLKTERFFFFKEGQGFLPLKTGLPRPGHITWENQSHKKLQACLLTTPPASHIIKTEPIWYLDLKTVEGILGKVETTQPPQLINKLLKLPALTDKELSVVSTVIAEKNPEWSFPAVAKSDADFSHLETTPIPVLKLATLNTDKVGSYRNYPRVFWKSQDFDYALVYFRYKNIDFAANEARSFVESNTQIIQVKRNNKLEQAYVHSLKTYGFQPAPEKILLTNAIFGLSCEADWPNFMHKTVPLLRNKGWIVEHTVDFRHHALQVDNWQIEIRESEGWFDLDMGIIVDGKQLPLAPMLRALFQRDYRWLDHKEIEKIDDNESIAISRADESKILVKAERIKPLVKTLIDLFDQDTGESLRILKYDAPRLLMAFDKERWQFKNADSIIALAKRLTASEKIKPINPPSSFALKLRPYQCEGLGWLQYLCQHGIGGILADDMGLGKTAQTLAHLLLEKEAGRLTKPALVVLPTSLVFNWKNEAARFAPTLSILSLYGIERKIFFSAIPKYDVILTTYSLLWRDADNLKKHAYYQLILDEAQMVKNPLSRAAEIIRQINCQHRLCLTGTPMENHLGELWTQFDFLLPGFLGDNRQFNNIWRNPIEKAGDKIRKNLLADRLKPFILRRSKEKIAKELPPKNIIVRRVELHGKQRDLYETVRVTMDQKIRKEIAKIGFKRSQIVILDALLKLRQVCCDPRLLKMPAAQKIHDSAKLELLMDMLPELVAEGRRILLFSQFTSMLSLIEQELNKQKLGYVILKGSTVNRELPVSQFQSGKVPIFLISLKAGGLGLNLTAADTVIHYDPWWNPAIENQATDRAHRIGQQKRVFVYKLITAGSIEERILDLQTKKAALAASILSDDKNIEIKFSEKDLIALFAPLPEN